MTVNELITALQELNAGDSIVRLISDSQVGYAEAVYTYRDEVIISE